MPVKIGKSAATATRQQRLVRRGKSAPRNTTANKRWQSYLPRVIAASLVVLALVVLGVSYYAATSSAFFQVREVAVVGAVRTSADDIRAIVQRHAAETGVWRAQLEAISAEINRLPWVHKAIVSRVLPDGLRVTVKERAKTAVIIAANNKAIWVDGEGVKLGPLAPTDKTGTLILLKGWDERETEEALAGNRQRMETYMAMLADWDSLGLSKRISDINLADTSEVRLYLRSHPDVPISLGDRNWGTRLKDSLQILDNEKRSDVIALNAKLDDHVIVSYRENIASPAVATSGDRTHPAASPKPTARP